MRDMSLVRERLEQIEESLQRSGGTVGRGSPAGPVQTRGNSTREGR
jgi:hypothetical protein